MNVRSLKKGIRNLLAVILTLFLFLASLAGCLRITALAPSFMQSKAVSSNMSKDLYNSLMEVYENVSITSQVPLSYFQEVITLEHMESEQAAILSSIYNGTAASNMNTDVVHQALLQSFQNYCNENGIRITDEVETSLLGLADYTVQEYQKAVQLPFSDRLAQYIPRVVKLLDIALSALVVCLVLIALFLFKLFILPRHSFYHFGSAFIGTGFLNILLSVFCLGAKPYAQLALNPQAYLNFFVSCCDGFFKLCLAVGAGFVLTGMLFIIAANFISEHKRRLRHESLVTE